MKLNLNQTFTEIVKEEICFNLIKKELPIQVVILSFLKNIAEYNLIDNSIEFTTKYVPIIQLFNHFIKENSFHKMEILISNTKTLKDKKNNYKVKLKFENDFLNKISIDYLNSLQNENDKKNLLLGVFLSGGSVNNPKKSSYHFEIRIHNEEFKNLILKILIKFNFDPKEIFYKNKWIIYFKKSSDISDLLKILGANNSMFCLEDNRIERDMFNNLQRLINLEVFNINKTTKAAVEQFKMCEIIVSSIYYQLLNDKEKDYCNVRLKNPRASMQQICNIMNQTYPNKYQNLTKGSLCHIINKIKTIYRKI